MKKLLVFILTLALCLAYVSTVAAYEVGDPCLLYGYDPNTQDNYETYGDEVFFRNRPVKCPTGDLNILLNSYATKKIIDSADTYEDFLEIVSEDYFPELDISWMYCEISESSYDSLKKSFRENYYLYFTVQLEDNSKAAVTDALKALAPRIDIDIKDVIHYSYNLTDVSTALKVIAGWDVPHSVLYNYNRSGDIELSDVMIMLKAIAKWQNDGWYLRS